MIRPLGALLLLACLAAPVLAQTDPMQAPPAEELDRRSEDFIGGRRWMAVIIIGGTLIAGGGASFMRRRARRKAEAAQAPAPQWPTATALRATDPALRTDRLRKALRAGLEPPDEERASLAALFREDEQASLRVLVLEALDATGEGAPQELLEEALADPADSVRLAALQRLMERTPTRQQELARAHLADPGVEVRALCAYLLADTDPDAAAGAMLQLVRDEALGPRELHALRRTTSFFAEDLGDPARASDLEALRDEVDDPERLIDWALEKLGRP